MCDTDLCNKSNNNNNGDDNNGSNSVEIYSILTVLMLSLVFILTKII